MVGVKKVCICIKNVTTSLKLLRGTLVVLVGHNNQAQISLRVLLIRLGTFIMYRRLHFSAEKYHRTILTFLS